MIAILALQKLQTEDNTEALAAASTWSNCCNGSTQSSSNCCN